MMDIRAGRQSRCSNRISFPFVFTLSENTIVVTERDCVGLLVGIVLFVVVFARQLVVDFIAMAPRKLFRAGVGAANIAAEVAIAGE